MLAGTNRVCNELLALLHQARMRLASGVQALSNVRMPPARHAAPVRVPAAQPRPTSPADEEKVCRSPISGVVVRIAVQPGQTLQVGDILLILEAMKMETNITSPAAGKIAAIKVGQGDAVQAGEVVAEFE